MEITTNNSILDFCMAVVEQFIAFGKLFIDLMQTPIVDLIDAFADIPLIGPLVVKVTDFINSLISMAWPDFGTITTLEFMLGYGLPAFISITLVIWLLNIIT